MRLVDVEVLGARIDHQGVAGVLDQSTTRAIVGAIQLAETQRETVREAELEELKRRHLRDVEATEAAEAAILEERARRETELALTRLAGRLEQQAKDAEIAEGQRAVDRAAADQSRELQQALDEVELARLRGEVEQYIARAKAVDPTIVAAIQAFGEQRFTEVLVTALGPAAAALGLSGADLLHQQFKDTPLGGILGTLTERRLAPNGRGTARLGS
jgi:hypothetical protein